MADTETREQPETSPVQAVVEPKGAPSMAMRPRNIDEGMKLAALLAKSDLVPKDFQNKPANVYLAIQWGAELGLPPGQALQSIAVINGRPSMWGDGMLALVWASGKLQWIDERYDDTDPANPTAVCEVQRVGAPRSHTQTFSLKDATAAGLSTKTGPWQQYRLRMLKLRARGFCLRDVFPDVLRGIISAEEADDLPVEAVSVREVDHLDTYLFELPDEEQAEIKALATQAKRTKGQIITLLKRHPNNPKGLKAELQTLATAAKNAEVVQGQAQEAAQPAQAATSKVNGSPTTEKPAEPAKPAPKAAPPVKAQPAMDLADEF